MKRVLSAILVVLLLFAGLSWAAHPERLTSSPNGDGRTHLLSLDASEQGQQAPEGLQEAACDHCCHGSAHYVGLPSAVAMLPALPEGSPPHSWPASCRSRDNEPPLPPPDIFRS